MITVNVIDDDPLVAQSLKTILEASGEIRVTATGGNAQEAVSLYQKSQPDVLLMDIRMGSETGLTAAETILKATPQARILFLTTFSDDEYIQQALQLGAKGYLIKQDLESIVPAIKAVAQDQTVFGSEVANKLSSFLEQSNHDPQVLPPELTQREFAILQEVANGKNNREIAEALFLSEGTVRNNLSMLLSKLDLRDRTQLAIYYYRELGGKRS